VSSENYIVGDIVKSESSKSEEGAQQVWVWGDYGSGAGTVSK